MGGLPGYQRLFFIVVVSVLFGRGYKPFMLIYMAVCFETKNTVMADKPPEQHVRSFCGCPCLRRTGSWRVLAFLFFFVWPVAPSPFVQYTRIRRGRGLLRCGPLLRSLRSDQIPAASTGEESEAALVRDAVPAAPLGRKRTCGWGTPRLSLASSARCACASPSKPYRRAAGWGLQTTRSSTKAVTVLMISSGLIYNFIHAHPDCYLIWIPLEENHKKGQTT